MKVIAMYLPQFHQVRENDQWWGEGFTEWTAVRGAKQLYKNHNQPRIPLDKNYYNLLEYETMSWQAKLMKKYGIDGLCMYHYWFKDGKRILEKPAENLLEWKDIPMPFCFCWANETWARSWSNIQNKNIWADRYEKEEKTCENGILLEQKYGREKQWKDHFEYLLPFFLDERYIKIDGRPLFLIYKTLDFFCLMEMIDYWKGLAKLHSLPDIYVVGQESNTPGKDYLDANLNFQPARAMEQIPTPGRYARNGVKIWEYDDVWNEILREKTSDRVFLEGFVGYDNTPRHGINGHVVEHSSPEKFSSYFTELLAKSAAYEKNIVFLNAWNEWGEGMYLEPDENCGDGYLNAVSIAKNNYVYLIDKYRYIEKINRENDLKNDRRVEKRISKDQYYLHILDHWMTLRENNFSIEHWLKNEKCKRIAVYGYGILGKHLCSELHGGDITVEYIIDQKKGDISIDYKLYLPTEAIPETDAVIVTAIFDYDKIYKKLKNKGICKIISLETILYEN